MKALLKSVVVVALSLPLIANDTLLINQTTKKDTNALIAVFDDVGLNNYRNCKKLALSNMDIYKSLVTKKSVRKQRFSKVEVFTFNEQINRVGFIESKRFSKLVRKTKELHEEVKRELKKDTSDKAKEVLSIFRFLNQLVDEQYRSFDNVAVVIFSNMRDSTLTKKQREEAKSIVMNKKVSLSLFAKSGLECLEGTSTKQRLSAEKSVIDFYKSKLQIESKKLSVYTIY